MNFQEIRDAITETESWEPCTEKDMRLRALGSILRARGRQIQYQPGVWLNKSQCETPSGFWNLFFGSWLEYDDTRFFDCARRINLNSGRTESTYMRREYGYDPCTHDLLDLKPLLEFIKVLEEGSD